MHVNNVQWLDCLFSMIKTRQTLKFQKITNSLSCSFGCPGSRISLNNTKKYLTNLIMPVKKGDNIKPGFSRCESRDVAFDNDASNPYND